MKSITYEGEILCSFEDKVYVSPVNIYSVKGDLYICLYHPDIIFRIDDEVITMCLAKHIWSPPFGPNTEVLWESEEHLIKRMCREIFD